MKNALRQATLRSEEELLAAREPRQSMTVARDARPEPPPALRISMLPPGVHESSFILRSEPPAYTDDDDMEAIFDGWAVSSGESDSVPPASRVPTVRPSSFPTAPPPSLGLLARLKF